MQSLQSTALGGGDATPKTANYVLVAADAGTTVAMNAAGATTITVNTGLFAAGDTVFIQNRGAGACTVTAGTATVATAGSLILPQNDAGILYFTSASAAIFYDYVQPGITSPVTTKGDLYSFTTTDARLAVGNDGETLVADSSTATGLAYREDYAAGKNKIINGAFDNWQRGTSFSGLADGAYFADRFAIAFSAGGASNTASQQTFTPGAAPVAGYEGQFFGRVAATSGGASTVLGISQKVENVRTLAGETFTFSFYAKADSARTITSYLIQNFGSGGSASVVNTTTFALTTSFVRYSYTATMPSVSGKTIGAGSFFYIDFELAAGQATGSPVLDTWGWQLEAGSVATAFNTATGTIQGELAACQRYYYRHVDGATQAIGVGYNETASSMGSHVKYPVTMRITPTLVVSTGSAYYTFYRNGANDDFNSFTLGAASPNAASIYNNSEISGTAGQAGNCYSNNASASLAFNSEL